MNDRSRIEPYAFLFTRGFSELRRKFTNLVAHGLPAPVDWSTYHRNSASSIPARTPIDPYQALNRPPTFLEWLGKLPAVTFQHILNCCNSVDVRLSGMNAGSGNVKLSREPDGPRQNGRTSDCGTVSARPGSPRTRDVYHARLHSPMRCRRSRVGRFSANAPALIERARREGDRQKARHRPAADPGYRRGAAI